MLSRLFRGKKISKMFLRKQTHPLLLKIRSAIENYSETLGSASSYTDEKQITPYKDIQQEVEAISKSIPETPGEDAYLDRRWEELVSDIERSRLKYFDEVFGTNTYFQEIEPYQERVFIDTILEKRFEKFRAGKQRLSSSVTQLGDMSIVEGRKFLRPQRTVEEVFNRGFDNKLIMIQSAVYDGEGTAHVDHFRYLHPGTTTDREKGVLVKYITHERDRLHLYLSHQDSTMERVGEGFQRIMRENTFHEMIPYIDNGKAYFFSRRIRGFFRCDVEQVLSGSRDIVLRDALDLVEGDSIEEVISLERVRSYFFCFKDDFSFGICRQLKYKDILPEHIHQISIDPSGKIAALTFKMNGFYITVLQDILSKKFFTSYGFSRSAPLFSMTETSFIQVSPSITIIDMKREDFRLDPSTLRVDTPSLIRYINDNNDALMMNCGWAGVEEFEDSRLKGAMIVDIRYRFDFIWLTSLIRKDGLTENDFNSTFSGERDEEQMRREAREFRKSFVSRVCKMDLRGRVVEVLDGYDYWGRFGTWKRGEKVEGSLIIDLSEVERGVVLLTREDDGNNRLYCIILV